MKRLILAIASASLLSCGLANAADMPVKARPLPPPPPVFSWTGFYIGAHIGSAWSTVESTLTGVDVVVRQIPEFAVGGLSIPISSHNINGFLGGVQAGYNWQFAPWGVFGIETQWSWSDVKGTTPCVLILACSTDTKWVGTLAARLGFTVDRALIYVKGGVGWADSDYTVALNLPAIGGFPGLALASTVGDTRVGAMWGAGVEYAFAPNWSAKIEYDFIDFRTESYTFPVNFNIGQVPVNINLNSDVSQKLHLVKFGINYRFDWGKGPVAVRAAY